MRSILPAHKDSPTGRTLESYVRETTLASIGCGERRREPLKIAIFVDALSEARLADVDHPMPTAQLSLRVLSCDFVDEQILGRDDVSLHAEQFGDVSDPSSSVAQTCGLNNDVNGRADHLSNYVMRKVEAAHDHHRFDPAYRVAW